MDIFAMMKTLLVALTGDTVTEAATPAEAIPPDPDNAALLYYQAFLALAKLDDSDARTLIVHVAKGNVAPDDRVRKHLQWCREAVGFAEAAARVRECHWGNRLSQGLWVSQPQLMPARWLALVLVADARVRASDGDCRGALERCLLTDAFARHFGGDTMMSFVIGIAIRALGYRCMADVTGQAAGDRLLLQWLKDALVTTGRPEPSLARPLRIERAMVADLMRMDRLEKFGRVVAEPFGQSRATDTPEAREEFLRHARQAYGDHAAEPFEKVLSGAPGQIAVTFPAVNEEMLARARERCAERFTAALTILGKPMPYEQTFTQLEQLGRTDDLDDPISHMSVLAFMPRISRLYNLKTRAQAKANALKVAVAVCLERATSGQLPHELPAEVPQDPFSGWPFEYESTEEGFTLRCRAKELKTEKLHEYVFTLK